MSGSLNKVAAFVAVLDTAIWKYFLIRFVTLFDWAIAKIWRDQHHEKDWREKDLRVWEWKADAFVCGRFLIKPMRNHEAGFGIQQKLWRLRSKLMRNVSYTLTITSSRSAVTGIRIRPSQKTGLENTMTWTPEKIAPTRIVGQILLKENGKG